MGLKYKIGDRVRVKEDGFYSVQRNQRIKGQVATVIEIIRPNIPDIRYPYRVEYQDIQALFAESELEDVEATGDTNMHELTEGDRVIYTGNYKLSNDEFIGRTATVYCVLDNNRYFIKFEDTGKPLTRAFGKNLELITETNTMTNENKQHEAYSMLAEASGIEIGDTVRLIRAWPSEHMGWSGIWTHEMHLYVGEVVVVNNIRCSSPIHSLNYNLVFNNGFSAWFPIYSLELVSKGVTTPKVRIYDRDVNFESDGSNISIGCQDIDFEVVETIYTHMQLLRDKERDGSNS